MDCREQSICLFCQPNRNQRKDHNYRTHSNHSSYSCCPNIDKTNVPQSHWRGNGLKKKSWSLSHTFKVGDQCPSKEESINQSCLEFVCFPYNQIQWRYLHFTWIPHARKTERKHYVCLTLGMRYITITSKFQHPRILTDLFLLPEIQVWVIFGSHTCYLHLTLM